MRDGDAFEKRFEGPGFALGAALLFGLTTPFAKIVGGGVDPFVMAGLLYLGSGVGLALWEAVSRGRGEAQLARGDWSWMAAIVFFGGIAAPVLLMFGLQRTAGSTASLLLNLEGLATMAIAWLVYRESVDRRLLLGAFAILSGAIVLTWDFSAVALSDGALFVAGACLCWGIDNNFTRKLSAGDPIQIARIKGLAAGTTNVLLGLAMGAHLPSPSVMGYAAFLGVIGYGISLVLFVLALRALGAARTGAYFSTAPFVGAAVAIPVLGDPITAVLLVAGLLMALGVWLHLTENHEHWHEHETLTHAHAHVHDAHHQHMHRPGDPLGEPHTHVHTHAPLRHKHAHYPDLHHRHDH